MIQTVLKRDGRVVGFNEEKIKAAIDKAMYVMCTMCEFDDSLDLMCIDTQIKFEEPVKKNLADYTLPMCVSIVRRDRESGMYDRVEPQAGGMSAHTISMAIMSDKTRNEIVKKALDGHPRLLAVAGTHISVIMDEIARSDIEISVKDVDFTHTESIPEWCKSYVEMCKPLLLEWARHNERLPMCLMQEENILSLLRSIEAYLWKKTQEAPLWGILTEDQREYLRFHQKRLEEYFEMVDTRDEKVKKDVEKSLKKINWGEEFPEWELEHVQSNPIRHYVYKTFKQQCIGDGSREQNKLETGYGWDWMYGFVEEAMRNGTIILKEDVHLDTSMYHLMGALNEGYRVYKMQTNASLISNLKLTSETRITKSTAEKYVAEGSSLNRDKYRWVKQYVGEHKPQKSAVEEREAIA